MTGPDPTDEGLGTCGTGYCDRPAVTYLSWTGDRTTFIVGPRAGFLAHAGPADGHVLLGPLALRCLDCAHHALDDLLHPAPVSERTDTP